MVVAQSRTAAGAAAARALVRHVADARAVESGTTTLGDLGPARDTPELVSAALLEGSTMRARRVEGATASEFVAFLDGIQRTEVIGDVLGIPIVLGTVASVVRVRRERRLSTWGHRPPVVQRRLYIPFEYLPQFSSEELGRDASVSAVIDTLETHKAAPHPMALFEAASQCVDRDRAELEMRLAEEWCRREDKPILIDGGIQGSAFLASAACAVGVVKSHRRLFAEGPALRVVFGLQGGERSSTFRVTPRGRHTVMSWYLRVRYSRGRDAMWGLVRVEAAESGDPGRRADEISRWLLGENSPLALPDGRWDKMTYGIHDCEEFLRAIS